MTKLQGYDFYQSIGSPKYVVAPMVDQSELPFRMLCKSYGAQLLYSPMLHSGIFLKDEYYRKNYFSTCPEDTPLLVQFCGNDPETVVGAARLVQDSGCVGVDLNLGCPQHIAKRGHYGSFLMEELPLIRDMVSSLHQNLDIPVTCKIRIFPEIDKTLYYAKMLEEAGAQILCVHGRTREQKGHKQGLADWDVIKLVKESIKTIPVLANGNIQTFQDIERCMEYTGVDGVMSAETLLENPALFSNRKVESTQLAREYIQWAKKYPVPASMIRGHLFKILAPLLDTHTDFRERLSTHSHTWEDFHSFVEDLITRLQVETEEEKNQRLQFKSKHHKFKEPVAGPSSEDILGDATLSLFD